MDKYKKKENEDYKKIQTHLKVLEERTKTLKKIVAHRKKLQQYNASDPKRVLKHIKKAKESIANAGFI